MTHKFIILSLFLAFFACENSQPTGNSPSNIDTISLFIPVDTIIDVPAGLKKYELIYHTIDYEKVINDEPTQDLQGGAFVALSDSVVQIVSGDYNATLFVSKTFKNKQTASYNLVYKKGDVNKNKKDAIIFVEVEADSIASAYIQFQSKDTVYSFHNCTSK